MKNTKWIAAAGVIAAAALASPSFAQDTMGGPGGPWSGFYIGANAGWTGDTGDLHFRDLSADQDLSFTHDKNGSSFFGGGHVGYNWWMGSMIGGIEGDADWANHVDYLASVRGRLGFAPSDRWMLYGTAGVAFMGGNEHFTGSSTTDATTTRFSRSSKGTGFVGGVGTEFALNRNLGLGVEGLWYDFGKDSHHLAVSPGEDFTVRDNQSFGAIRARLTWYLNQ